MCPYLLHAFLQFLDGVLTCIGVWHLGQEAEGNPIVRSAMITIGVLPALVLVKGFGIAVTLCLLRPLGHLVMSRRSMIAINVLYILSAFAWMVVLFNLFWGSNG